MQKAHSQHTLDHPQGSSEPRRNSLLAFCKAIRFAGGKSTSTGAATEQGFAQPHPRARQRRALAEERYVVRIAN